MREGKSAQSDVPNNRFDLEAWYHPDSNRPGSISTRGGYYLSHDESFRQFDPSFFGISPLEAASMDPQQKKLCEVVYESFESAGATLEELSGSKTSCYVGCFTHDVASMNSREVEYGVPYQMTGSDMTILSNRINYVFNLKGPSLTIDTACSSSLYALHMACQSLISGDSDAAVVGGTNIILGIEQQISSVRLGVLSPTSTCHTFDESADGFGRGEGVCSVYLKKLSKAIADNDPVRGVIRATAINANGRSQGINHPSAGDQETVIRAAYAKAGLCPDQTGYFELHGTGTPVGDPIEVAAIANVFAAGRNSQNPLLLGSIKTNIGHTEGASGLASVVKAVLSIENSTIPAAVGVSKLNPSIDFKEGRLEVVRSLSPWPKGLMKRASVNSFGYGGANAHCIVESPEILLRLTNEATVNGSLQSPASRSYIKSMDEHCDGAIEESTLLAHHSVKNQASKRYLLVFSAHDQPTLERNIAVLADVANEYNARDIAHTLAYRRTKHRSAALAGVVGEDIGSQLVPGRISYDSKARSGKPVVAFAFTGQGAQWPTMGNVLIQQYPIVRKTIEILQAALDCLPTPPSWRLLDELSRKPNESRVQEAALSQPLCTGIQIALTVLLKSWGVHPKGAVGHSSGEVAAAFAAGLLTAEEAIAVAYYRGISVAVRHKPGAMMAVGLGAVHVSPYIEKQPDIVIACHNSPQSVTLSGDVAAIDEVHQALVNDGVFARKLNTSNNAYHSHLVKEAGKYYQDCFESSLPSLVHAARTTNVPMYSCITGKALNSQNDVGIDYWRKNLENPVLFTQAFSSLLAAQPDVNHIIEIGPHSALAGPIRQIRASINRTDENLSYLPTILRNEDGVENMLKLAGSLFIAGYHVDMKAVNADGAEEGKFLPSLPTYQWNYENDIHWTENRLSRQLRFRKHPRHDLLGSRQLGNSAFSPEWRNRLKLKEIPWISDHKVGEDVIFPAAGYMAMAIEALTQIAEIHGLTLKGYTFQGLHINAPLVLDSEGEVETLFNLRALNDLSSQEGKKRFDFSVSSVNADDKSIEHAVGRIEIEESNEAKSTTDLKVKGHRGAENRDSSDRRWYAALENIGLNYGPAFRPLKDIHTNAESNEAMSYINLLSTKDNMVQESRYMVHPTTLDGCMQLAVIAAHNGNAKEIVKAYLPAVIDNMTIWQTSNSEPLSGEGILRSYGIRHGMRSAHGSTELYDPEGRQLAELTVSLYSLEGGFGRPTSENDRQPYTRLVWQPDIDRLHGERMRTLYPSGASDASWITLSHHLDDLAELLILDTYKSLPDKVDLKEQFVHLKKYTEFLIRNGKSLSESSPASKLSNSERKQLIEDTVKKCGDKVPEADLVAHMSTKMPAILRGEAGALDVMLEDGRLNKIYEHGFSHLAAYPQLQNVVRLIAHKEPRLKILEVGAGTGGATKPMLEALQAGSLMPRFIQYTFTDITTAFLGAAQEKFQDVRNIDFRALDIEKNPLDQGFEAGTYDIVLASNVIHATRNITKTLERCRTLLKPDGRIIIIETTRPRLVLNYMLGPLPGFWLGEEDDRSETPFLSKESWNDRLLEAGFSGNSILLDDYAADISSNSIIVSNVQQNIQAESCEPEILWLVYNQEPHSIVKEVETQAKQRKIETRTISMAEMPGKVQNGDRILLMAELEGALLANMTEEEMYFIKLILKTASSVIWVTRGGLLMGKKPEYSLVFGIAKSIMTEQPTVRISSVDLDPDETNETRSAEMIVQHEVNLRGDHDRVLDTELIEANGMVYISRYCVDAIENQDFTRQLRPSPEQLRLSGNLELNFQQVGQIDSFYLKEKSSATDPKEHEILVAPTIYNLGRAEAAVLKGLQDSDHFSNLCIAVVKDIGPNALKFKDGDRVICFSPGKFDSTFITNEARCELIDPDDDVENLVSSLLPYCTALYALSNLGNATGGQTVLVHGVSEPKHIAAVRLARLAGCNTIVTFSSEQRRALFHARYPELDACRSYIANPKLFKTLKGSEIGPGGPGIDVVIVSSGNPQLPEVWASLSENGRLICLGESEVPNIGILDPSVFARGASFVSFNMADMIKTQVEDVGKLVRKVILLVRDDSIPSFTPEAAFDISDLPTAVAVAAQEETTTSVALTYGPKSTVPIHLSYKAVAFPPENSYLLVGCLGGLGRSLVMWMFARGARHFIFLSRSGADKPEAAMLIEELNAIAAKSTEDSTITIVRGDVASRADVDRAIAMKKTPIRGVMQQAMFLKVRVYTNPLTTPLMIE